MKLISIHITNYRNVEDSGEFKISDITCLVGKNESGKTSILKAMEGLNPYDSKFEYDKDVDYPRRLVLDYESIHKGEAAEVCVAEWKLDAEDIEILEDELGEGCLKCDTITVKSYYGAVNTWNISVNEKKIIKHFKSFDELSSQDKSLIAKSKSVEELYQILENEVDLSEGLSTIRDKIAEYREKDVVLYVLDVLNKRMPKFLYFSHYSQMNGAFSVDKYHEDKKEEQPLKEGNRLFIEFMNYAGLSLSDIESTGRYEVYKSKLESASTHITNKISRYWSQNRHLEVEFDISEGKAEDPAPFNQGVVIRARIKNTIHRVTVPFDERSAGFIWFFSFLVHFSQVQKNYKGNLIILLDEPGLTLHAKAQYDLLRYMKEQLIPHYQVIYTTHSPFMLPQGEFDKIRTVEDVMIKESEDAPPEILGVKVSSDFMRTNKDTVFPLQTALGYEVAQSLFIGKNILLVEGPSDIIYMYAFSNLLNDEKRKGLNDNWVICPTSGIGKIVPFANLFLSHGGDKNLIVFTDYSKKENQLITNLKQSELFSSVFLASDYCDKKEAEIEDIIGVDLYLNLLKESCNIKIAKNKITSANKVVKEVVKEVQKQHSAYSHYEPAKWLQNNLNWLKENKTEDAMGRFEKLFADINKKIKK